MDDRDYRRELEEAEHLRKQISMVIDRIDRVNRENHALEAELERAIHNTAALINQCINLDHAVYEDVDRLSDAVGGVDISTKEVFQALNELSEQYFHFKNLSTASKNLSQFNDEYYTRFSYYIELRRITLGYVVGLDSHIISSNSMRKKVEKAYLQNTEYWLAYCISAVMLWASDEREAAQRAMSKSLSISYFNACLFYLLINLRFNRIDAAKKWYVKYLERTDMNNLGDEWQYLLQAYLFGAFGADEKLQETVEKCFRSMLAQVEVTTVDFANKFIQKAFEFAELYVHKTRQDFTILGRTCTDYPKMKELLSTAEKNIEIAKYYNKLAESESKELEELPQRIENVLYALVNDYDEEELKVVQKIKYNEAIISARGDISIAQSNNNAMYADRKKEKNFGDLILSWAFADDASQADVSVRRFSISLMKESVMKGFENFAKSYRTKEEDKYPFVIDDCKLECNEHDLAEAEQMLDKYYDKNKIKYIFNDRHILIYTGMCALALLLILSLIPLFSPFIMTIGILVGLAGSFLLWRRIIDMDKILREKKRKGKILLKQALEELLQWRSAYKEADAKNVDLLSAVETF